jgi:hypothetical protein
MPLGNQAKTLSKGQIDGDAGLSLHNETREADSPHLPAVSPNRG